MIFVLANYMQFERNDRGFTELNRVTDDPTPGRGRDRGRGPHSTDDAGSLTRDRDRDGNRRPGALRR